MKVVPQEVSKAAMANVAITTSRPLFFDANIDTPFCIIEIRNFSIM